MSALTKVLEALDEVESMEVCEHSKNALVCLKGAASALGLLEDQGESVGSNDLPLESNQAMPESGTVVAGEPGNGEGDSGDGSDDGDSEGNQ